MKKINTYIMKQLFIGFFLMLMGMTALIWLSQSLKMIDWIVNKGVSVGMFIELTMLVLPNFMTIITPLAFFIVLMFVYSRLLADRELVVMKASGMSALDLAKPAIYVGLLLVGLGYMMTLWLVPYSVSLFKELQFKIRNNLAQVVIQEGEFNQLPNQITVYVRSFKPSGELEGIMIHDYRNQEKRVIMVAHSGLYVMDEKGAQILMYQGTRQEYNHKTKAFSSLSFDQNKMVIEESKKSKSRRQVEEEQSLWRLLSVGEDELTALDYRKYKVEAFQRLTQPLYALVFMFVGLLACLLGHYNRRGQSGRVYFAVGLVLVLQALSLAFDKWSCKNLWFLIGMGLNVFVPIVISFVILKRGRLFSKETKLSRFMSRFFIFLLVVFFSFSVRASPQFVSDTSISKEAPVSFEADSISYDKQGTLLTAKGNVVITQEGTTLHADKLEYNQKTQQGKALGHILLMRPDGVKITAEEISLKEAFNEAELKKIFLTFADGSTFKADKVDRFDNGNKSEFQNVFFTPCTYCEPQNPLWALEASKVKHDYAEKKYTFYNAFFDVKGVPVFFFPYFSYPDFQVKRKTGLLAPAFAKTKEMGFGIETPFFVDISPSQDLFVRPIFSGEHFPLTQLRYRGIYEHSALTGYASLTKDRDEHNTEGHIKLDYEANMTDNWRFQGSYYRVSNNTYLRRYHIDNTDDQMPWIGSFGKLEYFNDAHYGYLNVMDFESQRRYISNKSMPFVTQANYSYTTQPLWNGLYSVSVINGADVYRKTEERSTRLTYQQSFVLPYISNSGFVFENQIMGRVDGYALKDEDKKSDNVSRFYTNASIKASYPLMQAGKTYSQLVEPIVMAVWSPNIKDKDNIPNEDCLDVFFDDVNLFTANRYNGYDRVETRSRLNYGLKWSLYGSQNMYLSAMLGQSYRFSSSAQDDATTGFDSHFSSYVGHLNMDFKNFGIGYRFRLDKDTLSTEMSEARMYIGRDPLRISASYLNLKASDELVEREASKDREEVYLHIASKINQNWSASWYYRYDLSKGGGPTETGWGLQYDNECITLSATMEKELTKDEDYEGDTSYFLRVSFKTLGGI